MSNHLWSNSSFLFLKPEGGSVAKPSVFDDFATSLSLYQTRSNGFVNVCFSLL